MEVHTSLFLLLLVAFVAVTADSKGGQQVVEPEPRTARCPEIKYRGSDICPTTQHECTRDECSSDQACCYDGCRFYCADLRPVCPVFCRQPRESREQVCGSDGRTYRSLCLLEKTACETGVTITKESDGPCASEKCGQCGEQQQQQQQQQLQYADDLVCGSDGVTYTSVCDLKRTACIMGEDISIGNQGPCPIVMCGIHCENPGGPVCGSDYRTYSSSCHLLDAQCSEPGLTLLYDGRCRLELTGQPLLCPKPGPTTLPAKGAYCGDSCSTDEDCTGNKKCCSGSCGKQCVIPYFKSSRLEGCPIPCQGKIEPVCGSDGFTYPNQCRLDSVNECGANRVYTVSKGACK
ncbi:agrin-like [Panulirus ornatus]|uniref:agrin-like n=1 Tax=Panulirus ornatus TaxID=150431 RepID=UPI003A857316